MVHEEATGEAKACGPVKPSNHTGRMWQISKMLECAGRVVADAASELPTAQRLFWVYLVAIGQGTEATRNN
jgi:hypothetical protein